MPLRQACLAALPSSNNCLAVADALGAGAYVSWRENSASTTPHHFICKHGWLQISEQLKRKRGVEVLLYAGRQCFAYFTR